MTIHSNLTPLTGAEPPFAWPDLPELGSGGFASVRSLGPAEVLKLTCCSATNAWLKQASRGSSVWPAAFPRVHACLGDLAVDSDDMVFCGWQMERLFALDDKEGAIAARSATIRRRMRGDPGAAARPVSPEKEAQEALLSVTAFCDVAPDEHWAVDANAALLLASACDGELRQGFLALRKFVLEQRVKLDVANPSNVMMDCFGRLRLADPITMRLDDPTLGPPAARSWLAVRLPYMQRGFDVQTRWSAVPFSRQELAQAAATSLQRKGVALTVCNDERAASLVARQPETIKVFEFGKGLDELLSSSLLPDLMSQASLR